VTFPARCAEVVKSHDQPRVTLYADRRRQFLGQALALIQSLRSGSRSTSIVTRFLRYDITFFLYSLGTASCSKGWK